MAPEILIFQFLVVVFSIVVHEVSHGFAAEKLGDPTARMMGRLTLNPVPHIDPIGSVILPLLLVISGSPVFFAWAKPVPVNEGNLKNPAVDGGKIAFAGPLSNIILALAVALMLRFFGGTMSGMLPFYLTLIVYINIGLAVFNLIPIPPLDGSRVLEALFAGNEAVYRAMRFLEQYGFIILLVLVFTGGFSFIYPITEAIFRLFVGGSVGI